MLALRDSDNLGRLHMFGALSGTSLWGKSMNAGWTPVTVRYFEMVGGARRVAVLSLRESDQRPIVAIFNADTGARVQNVKYLPGAIPVNLTIVPDTTLDLDGQPEPGVTMEDGTIRIRDSLTRELLQTLNAP